MTNNAYVTYDIGTTGMSWSVLQSASAAGQWPTTLESTTATLGSNCSEGTALVAYVVCGTGANVGSYAISTVQDNSGNNFTRVSELPDAGHYEYHSIWVLETPSGDVGTTPTIKATTISPGSYAGSILVQEVSGIGTGTDGSVASLGFSGTSGTTSSPSYSSSAPDEFLVSSYSDDSGASSYSQGVTTWTAPSGWTADSHNVNSNTNYGGNIAVAYKDSTGGAETGSWSYSSSGGNANGIILTVAFLGQPEPVISTSSVVILNPSGVVVASSGSGLPATISHPFSYGDSVETIRGMLTSAIQDAAGDSLLNVVYV